MFHVRFIGHFEKITTNIAQPNGSRKNKISDLQNAKNRLLIGCLSFLIGAFYFLYQGIDDGVVSKEDVINISAKTKSIIEQPDGYKQSLHYVLQCVDYNNEFYVSPEYTKIFSIATLKKEITVDPNLRTCLNFIFGIEKVFPKNKPSKTKGLVIIINNQHYFHINENEKPGIKLAAIIDQQLYYASTTIKPGRHSVFLPKNGKGISKRSL